MANRYYSAIAQDNALASSVTSSSTTVILNSSPVGYPSSFPYVLALDYNTSSEELVSVTAASGTTLTVVRGFNGTSAVSHGAGATVRHVITAQDLTDAQNHIAATGSVHGLSGAIVGTSDTQTLTNKTIYGGSITGATLTSSTIDYTKNTLLNFPSGTLSFNNQTGTSYALQSSDAFGFVTLNNTSAVSVTIPVSTFTVGQYINVQQVNTGQVTITGQGGVTVTSTGATSSAPALVTNQSAATIICTASNTFTVVGNIQ